MRRDVIAVGMGDKGEWLSVPRIEPKVFVRQINAAVVANFDHEKFYARNCTGETGIRVRRLAAALTARRSSLSVNR